jgi:uncharacterized protein (UPF0332 family)
MTGRDFLPLVVHLAGGTTEAEWRSAISRAYYAAFHVARQLLADLGFRVPRADTAHIFVAWRLQNCSVPQIQKAGADLDTLRSLRNQADYDFPRPISQAVATTQVRTAETIILQLDSARLEPIRTQITDAMKVYERDVLKNVTWHP